MTKTIHVDLASPCLGDDLADYLCSHGLAATIVGSNDHCELEVDDAVDPEERLRQTFEDALRGWLGSTGQPLIPITSAKGRYVLRPPAG
jgi:hypothetical protein